MLLSQRPDQHCLSCNYLGLHDSTGRIIGDTFLTGLLNVIEANSFDVERILQKQLRKFDHGLVYATGLEANIMDDSVSMSGHSAALSRFFRIFDIFFEQLKNSTPKAEIIGRCHCRS